MVAYTDILRNGISPTVTIPRYPGKKPPPSSRPFKSGKKFKKCCLGKA
jgi:hypothetical protein